MQQIVEILVCYGVAVTGVAGFALGKLAGGRR